MVNVLRFNHFLFSIDGKQTKFSSSKIDVQKIGNRITKREK